MDKKEVNVMNEYLEKLQLILDEVTAAQMRLDSSLNEAINGNVDTDDLMHVYKKLDLIASKVKALVE